MKALMLVLLTAGYLSAYTGGLHASILETVPECLNVAGYRDESDSIRRYMKLMQAAIRTPEVDIGVPDDLMPEWLFREENCIGPWEHTLPDRLPVEVDQLLRNVAHERGVPFRFADETVHEWLATARTMWLTGEIDSALWVVARCCHIIQDLTMPMHCKMRGNLREVWQVLNKEDRNYREFEQFCSEVFQGGGFRVNLGEEFKVPKTLYHIARRSRKRYSSCDGWRIKELDFPPVPWLLPFVSENYPKATRASMVDAQKYTVLFIHWFFVSVGMKNNNLVSDDLKIGRL